MRERHFRAGGRKGKSLLPMVNPPEMLMKGKPSRLAPRFGVIPSFGLGAMTLGVSLVPVKQMLSNEGLHESVTSAVR